MLVPVETLNFTSTNHGRVLFLLACSDAGVEIPTTVQEGGHQISIRGTNKCISILTVPLRWWHMEN